MNRFQLRGTSLDDLKAQILVEHGPAARIVSAEKVTQGGVAGFLAKHFYEVTVEAPEVIPIVITPAVGRHRDPGDRVGIAALLAAADDADEGMLPRAAGTAAPTSTSLGTRRAAGAFEEVVAELSQRAGLSTPIPEPAAGLTHTPRGLEAEPIGADAESSRLLDARTVDPRFSVEVELPLVPEVSRIAGDLTLLVGVGQQALAVAHTLAADGAPIDVRAGGVIAAEGSNSGTAAVNDRRSALVARASVVTSGRAVLVAFGITAGVDPLRADVRDSLRSIGADEVWVVVDASTKHEDTARWVRLLSAVVPLDALAVVGVGLTSTPETVERLGIPIGYRDGPASDFQSNAPRPLDPGATP
ncbi:MAG: hypothetical protein JWQ43_2278 [Glaciihabitans sp.]|nr:hypothetical protein [Glaciihabitans sp.]